MKNKFVVAFPHIIFISTSLSSSSSSSSSFSLSPVCSSWCLSLIITDMQNAFNMLLSLSIKIVKTFVSGIFNLVKTLSALCPEHALLCGGVIKHPHCQRYMVPLVVLSAKKWAVIPRCEEVSRFLDQTSAFAALPVDGVDIFFSSSISASKCCSQEFYVVIHT